MKFTVKAVCTCEFDHRYDLTPPSFEIESESYEGFMNDDFLDAALKIVRSNIMRKLPPTVGLNRISAKVGVGIVDESVPVATQLQTTNRKVKVDIGSCDCLLVISFGDGKYIELQIRMNVLGAKNKENT